MPNEKFFGKYSYPSHTYHDRNAKDYLKFNPSGALIYEIVNYEIDVDTERVIKRDVLFSLKKIK